MGPPSIYRNSHTPLSLRQPTARVGDKPFFHFFFVTQATDAYFPPATATLTSPPPPPPWIDARDGASARTMARNVRASSSALCVAACASADRQMPSSRAALRSDEFALWRLIRASRISSLSLPRSFHYGRQRGQQKVPFSWFRCHILVVDYRWLSAGSEKTNPYKIIWSKVFLLM